MMWRALFSPMVALAMRNWERWRDRQSPPATPRAAVRATVSVSTAFMPSGYCLVKAASEADLNPSLPGSPIVQQTRDRMHQCPAVRELARGASVSNAMVFASVASGGNSENQYLLAVVPAKRLAAWRRR